MSRHYYTRIEILETLEIEAEFLIALEREAIVLADAPSDRSEEFSELMLERARVAYNLTRDLGVNLQGVAIIVRMREQMQDQRQQIERFLVDLEPHLRSSEQDL